MTLDEFQAFILLLFNIVSRGMLLKLCEILAWCSKTFGKDCRLKVRHVRCFLLPFIVSLDIYVHNVFIDNGFSEHCMTKNICF